MIERYGWVGILVFFFWACVIEKRPVTELSYYEEDLVEELASRVQPGTRVPRVWIQDDDTDYIFLPYRIIGYYFENDTSVWLGLHREPDDYTLDHEYGHWLHMTLMDTMMRDVYMKHYGGDTQMIADTLGTELVKYLNYQQQSAFNYKIIEYLLLQRPL